MYATYAPRHVGENWTSDYRPLKEIAADIRAAVKAAKKAGQIPADVKVSVRCRDGLAIDCTLTGWAREDVSEEYRDDYYTGRRMTPAAERVVNIVEAIRESHNRDASDPMVDYFDVTYYGSTKWDYKLTW